MRRRSRAAGYLFKGAMMLGLLTSLPSILKLAAFALPILFGGTKMFLDSQKIKHQQSEIFELQNESAKQQVLIAQYKKDIERQKELEAIQKDREERLEKVAEAQEKTIDNYREELRQSEKVSNHFKAELASITTTNVSIDCPMGSAEALKLTYEKLKELYYNDSLEDTEHGRTVDNYFSSTVFSSVILT